MIFDDGAKFPYNGNNQTRGEPFAVKGESPMSGDKRGFTLIELMIVVAIIGILAVVAIPAFVRYMRIAKTAEAYRNLDLLLKGARQYYVTPQFDANNVQTPCKFPHPYNGFQGVFSHSSLHACCTDGEADGKCEPNEAVWEHQAWKWSLFKISDKHYYVYEYSSNEMTNPRDNGAGAFGDLDCDGTYSTFYAIQKGYFGLNQITNCVVKRDAGVIVINETE